MKILFFVLLAFGILPACAQVVIEPNPSYTSSSEKPVLDSWLDAEALDGRTEPATINPSQKICFDKRMLIKAKLPQGTGYSCIFINTKIGLVAYTPITKNDPICELNINDPQFNLNVIGLKGKHYNYLNTEENGVIKHHVVTSNTHRQGLVSSAVSNNEPLYKKDEQREFFGKVKAWLYKANGRTESWWIFGKTIPDKLVMQPNKYLGLFGVGYQFTEEGLFIILQLEAEGAYQFAGEVLKLEDVPTCFNLTGFRTFEENEVVGAINSLQGAEENIDAQIGRNNASNNPCKELKEKTLKQNKKVVEISKQLMQSMQQGHLRQQQSLQLQVDKDVEQQQAIVDDYQEQLCKKEVQIARSGSQSSRQRLMQEKACIQQNLAFEQQMLTRFRSIQSSHRNEPLKSLKAIIQTRQDLKRRPCPR